MEVSQNLTMEEFKVLGMSIASFSAMELLNNVLIMGQPYVNGFIGILTVIYLIKKIIKKPLQNVVEITH